MLNLGKNSKKVIFFENFVGEVRREKFRSEK
jgi:hypothetical protein